MQATIQMIEDFSLNAWPSHQIQFYDGWLLRFSYFYTHRTNSVEQIGPSSIPLEKPMTVLKPGSSMQAAPNFRRRWLTRP